MGKISVNNLDLVFISRVLLQIICCIGLITTCSSAFTGKTLKLSSGNEIPILGLGTWQISPEDIDAAVTTALESGYRHIDAAFGYQNEGAIGKTLKKWFDKGGKRQDLFITTKLPPQGMRPEAVETYLKLSLERLGLTYVDLYLVHKPFGFMEDKEKHDIAINTDGTAILDLEVDHIKLWRAMEKQVKAGRTKSIGLSNFNESQIANVYNHAEIKPSNLQVELQAYNQQSSLRDFCANHSISVTGFSTLGSSATTKVLKTDSILLLPPLLENPVVKEIAVAHKRTPAQVLLRHSIQLGVVVIPKSTKAARIRENIGALDFELSDEDMRKLNGLDKGEQGRIFHFIDMPGVENHSHFPFAAQLQKLRSRS